MCVRVCVFITCVCVYHVCVDGCVFITVSGVCVCEWVGGWMFITCVCVYHSVRCVCVCVCVCENLYADLMDSVSVY